MKTRKYSNTRVEWNGEKFDSKAECSRYASLLVMQKAGRISDLTRQVSFVLAPKVVIGGKAKRSLIYRADFGYKDATGKPVVEDVKGSLTAVYKIKRHLMKSIHGIDILETK
ncbi:MAG TPA: DUF1064 domain-containing protein [Pseudoduganella sp.]